MAEEAFTLMMDWGIGGLSVYREAKSQGRGGSVIYLSDAGTTPYGMLAPTALADRLEFLVTLARSRWPIARVMIACNAASTSLAELKSRPFSRDLPFFGMIEPGWRLVKNCAHREVGLIGGRRTVESGVFTGLGDFVHLRQQVAQPLSALVEAGKLSGPEVEASLREILEPLRGIDALLLACTHYPALVPAIHGLFPDWLLLDPAAEAARDLPLGIGEQDQFFTSGSSEEMQRCAHLAFSLGIRAGALEF